MPFIPYPTPLHDEAGRLVGAVNMLVDITERKRAEEQQALLVRELHHRVRNTLATVQAIMGSTARSSATIEEFKAALIGRIGALAKTHRLLTEEVGSVAFGDSAAQRARCFRRRQRRADYAQRPGGLSVVAACGVARHGGA